MRDAVNEPHEGKRRNEATWQITKIHYERSRYIYELFYKKKAISRELYDFLLQEKWGDAALIAKWKKPGYEYLCSLQAIDRSNTNFRTTAICRVPLHLRKPGPQAPSVHTGCVSCASAEAGRLGGPIWWDTPRPADLVGWARAGCPTADKPGKKRKLEPEGEDKELEARAAALRRGLGGDSREADELERCAAGLRSSAEETAATHDAVTHNPPTHDAVTHDAATHDTVENSAIGGEQETSEQGHTGEVDDGIILLNNAIREHQMVHTNEVDDGMVSLNNVIREHHVER